LKWLTFLGHPVQYKKRSLLNDDKKLVIYTVVQKRKSPTNLSLNRIESCQLGRYFVKFECITGILYKLVLHRTNLCWWNMWRHQLVCLQRRCIC